MKITKIDRRTTGLFSKIANELSYHQENLCDFIEIPFSKTAFKSQMERKAKSFTNEQRETLVAALRQQYANVIFGEKVKQNLDLLEAPNTFTVTTGHQLSLFTGPLYSIYKIMHVIKMCEELKMAYPEINFVPIFWMASEDHDFVEINHFSLFGKTYSWNSDQKGPVGRFDCESLQEIRTELHRFFENQPESEVHAIIDAYNGENLAMAHFHLVHALFDAYGLIVIEPDNTLLKRVYLSVMRQEINGRFAEDLILSTTEKLEKLGYKGQVYPRPINFFYIEKGFRERIQWQNDQFFIEGKGYFSVEELNELLENHPENFSPNVAFRPIYQETILPNLCYVGGGGEMSYWLQLKSTFEEAGIPYPLIEVRNSLQIIDNGTQKKLQKLESTFVDFLATTDELKKNYIHTHSAESAILEHLQLQFTTLQANLVNELPKIDAQLKTFAEVEEKKLAKEWEQIQAKVLKQQKQQLDGAMKQIETLKEKLFPKNNLQERVELFLNFCPYGNVSEFLSSIYEAVDPFNPDFILVETA